MKIKYLFAVIALTFASSCSDISINSSSENIDEIFVDFDEIAKVNEQIRQKNNDFVPAYNQLIKKAEIVLDEGPFSVMDKKKIPPSGDKHDYLSMGSYWWPDPDKPDGLPYIRRDGEVNPEALGEYDDRDAKDRMLNNLETLTWAYYFSGEKKYAEKAVVLIETWFVNPETRMNPNLNFAQGIPGRSDGRGIGIIDFACCINQLIPPFQILEAKGLLSDPTKAKLLGWFEEYFDWLHTSKNGKNEDDQINNHGTWFDVQAAGIALYLGKTDMAKERLEKVKNKRIATQIEPDGSQPLEIARTRSLSYTSFNLSGFIHLAIMAQKVDVDLWNFETDDGRMIRKALDFLLPYSQGNKSWEHAQITSMEDAINSSKLIYLVAAIKTGDKKYLEVAKTISQTSSSLEILLYPLFEQSVARNQHENEKI